MFVELRAHTAFSFGDGAVSPEQLVMRAADLGLPAIGITDTADLGGLVRAAMAGREFGVRVIAGVELVVDGRPLALLARDERGYRHLASLVTRARLGDWRTWEHEQGARRRGRPGVTWAELAERAAGVQLLSGPPSGALAARLLRRDVAGARRLVDEWRHAFDDRVAIEVQRHAVGGAEGALAAALVELAESCGVPWVVTQDPRYVDEPGRMVHDALTALRHGLTLDEAERAGVLHPNGEWRLLGAPEMLRRWEGAPRGCVATAELAAQCAFDLAWMRPVLPRFSASDAGDQRLLREQTYAGARERWGSALTAAQERQLEHELAVIGRLGFAGFFLVMWDAVRFARTRGILCQGRGSAANSAVAYCLGVTAVDPVAHGLLFERFLSEVRVDGKAEAPDIDVDFEHDRREEVLDYMYRRWRRPHAALACTVQTYRAPNAVLDAMRAFGYPAAQALEISKRLHRYDPADAAVHLQERHAVRAGLDPAAPRVRALLATIAAFEGLPRLRATHVGGFVLSALPLGDWLPVEQTTLGRTIVQFDKDDLDWLGVPKFDFLGLGGLALVKRAFDAIERNTGRRHEIYRLPTDDAKTYDLISRGETVGTFQIESRAQIASLVHTRPERLYDLVVQVALIRPGPIQGRFVRPYTRRRRGLEPVTYAHPALEPILARTQGIPIFQEQAMAIAMVLGGYTGAEAYELRRTMGNIRKQGQLVVALERLRARLVERGVEPAVAQQVCDDMRGFANYGFPESHAWSFALIAYATAWLKANWPAEFYLGLLNAYPMGFYAPATLIHDARRHGVEVRTPCLCDGDWECTTEPGSGGGTALRIGWRFIRGVGEQALRRLRDARLEGPFTGIADVVRRARLTRAEATGIAQANGFQAWEPDRRKAAWEALRAVSDVLPLAPARRVAYHPAPLTPVETVALDYHTVGVSIHGHPMQAVRPLLAGRRVVTSRDLPRVRGGAAVAVAGMVVVRQRPATAKGVLFLLLEDEYGFVNVIVRPDLVAANEEVVKRAGFVVVEGVLQKRGPEVSVLGRAFEAVEGPLARSQSRDFR